MTGERSSATSLMDGMPSIVRSAEAVARKGRGILREWAQEVLAARESGNERRFVNAQIIYGGLMMVECAEDSHEIVIEPMPNGQSSILSSSVTVVDFGRELAELTALWARMETALWRKRSALWNERFPERPIDLDDSPWYETQEAPALESARGGVSKASVGDRESPDAGFPPTRE